MKKILILSILALMVSCLCISQIPDQVIYVDENCEAFLPDYTDDVTVSDNCEGVIVQQTPDPGSILDAATAYMDVTITATDAFNNQSSIQFRVIAIDTILPIITPDSTLMSFNLDVAGEMTTGMHHYFAHAVNQAVAARPDSALEQYPVLSTWDDAWNDYVMVTFYPPGGEGVYLSTFYPRGDYLCSCDSATYYAGMENGTMINFNFE